MKKCLVVCVWSLAVCAGIWAADTAPDPQTQRQIDALQAMVYQIARPAPRTMGGHVDRAQLFNEAFVTLTGEAINPLFGVTVLGAWTWLAADEDVRDLLPVYYQPEVWIPLACIILLMLFNSTLCEALPFLKIPLNALGDIVNKAGAIAVLPLVIKMFADTVAAPADNAVAWLWGGMFPAAYAAEAGAAGGAWLTFGWVIGAVVGVLIYGAVWLTFNIIDVLILICPFPFIDASLKSFRLAVIGALYAANQVSPLLGAIFAGFIVGVSLLLAGWSFRLSLFGLVWSTDILLFRRADAGQTAVRAFASEGLVRMGVPMRSLGTLRVGADGELEFLWRPWLVLGVRRVTLGAASEYCCGRGLVSLSLNRAGQGACCCLRLPPRYRGQADVFAAAYGLADAAPAAREGLRSWFGAFFGRAPA